MFAYFTDSVPSCWCTSLLVSIGTVVAALFVAKTLYAFAKSFFVFLLSEPLGLTTNFRSLGEWAVVTGGTDGIGKAYALDLARRGCNIVLISRTEAKLQAVAKEIEKAYPRIKTKVITADFTASEEIYDKIREQLMGLEIGTLINNVGMMTPFPEEFHAMPGGDKLGLDLIRCNVVAQTAMTHIVLPQMLKRKKGVIVGLSSGAGTMPIPYTALYSATKAFNDYLSRSLEMEYRTQGVIFQSITPYMVSTNMTLNEPSNLVIVRADKYARSCLNSVGYYTQTTGHPSHAIQSFFVGLLPSVLSEQMTLWLMNKSRPIVMQRLKDKGLFKQE